MKILVLGHNGMLGHMLCKYFDKKGFTVKTNPFRFPSYEFKQEITNFDGEYIINAIAQIPQKTKEFSVNYELPIWLSKNSRCRVIYPGTDSETESSEYAKSKLKAIDFIINNTENTKIIRASIIGPELKDKKCLLEWFINNKEETAIGWSHAMFNGITTLEWSKQCEDIISNWDKYPIENTIESNCLSKYDLLTIINKVFELKKEIIEDDSLKCNRCLEGNIKSKNIEDQILELKKYYYTN